MAKKSQKQLLEEWMDMEPSEKAKWNGFDGYTNGNLMCETSIFMPIKHRKR